MGSDYYVVYGLCVGFCFVQLGQHQTNTKFMDAQITIIQKV